MEIEIDGVKYQRKEQPKRKPLSKTVTAALMMAVTFGGYGSGLRKNKEVPSVDLIKEFGLIQQKKSNLSRSEREWVIWQFNKYWKLIP